MGRVMIQDNFSAIAYLHFGKTIVLIGQLHNIPSSKVVYTTGRLAWAALSRHIVAYRCIMAVSLLPSCLHSDLHQLPHQTKPKTTEPCLVPHYTVIRLYKQNP